MKRIRPRSLIAALHCAAWLALLGLTAAVAPASAATNLLTNPGFETGTLSGWTCSATDHVTGSPVHSGSDALAGAASASDDAQCTQTVSVQPSSSYTLTGWVQGSYVFLGDTGTGSTDTDTWTAAAAGWQQLSTSFSTGASTPASRCTCTAGTARAPTTPTTCRSPAPAGAAGEAAAARPPRRPGWP